VINLHLDALTVSSELKAFEAQYFSHYPLILTHTTTDCGNLGIPRRDSSQVCIPIRCLIENVVTVKLVNVDSHITAIIMVSCASW